MHTHIPFTTVGLLFLVGCTDTQALVDNHATAPEPEPPIIMTSESYTNPVYGYSLTYPGTLTLTEESMQKQILRFMQVDFIDEVIQVHVLAGDGESLDAFMEQTLKSICKNNSLQPTNDCPGFASREPYTTMSGLVGERIVLAASSVPTDMGLGGMHGPFYVFNIATVGPETFTVLAIHPSPSLSVDRIDEQLVRSIADNLQIHEVNRRPTVYGIPDAQFDR